MAPAVGSFCFLLDAVGAASMRPEHFRTYVWSLRLPVQVLFFIICFFYAATRTWGGGEWRSAREVSMRKSTVLSP